jgi:WD40 repeat protein
MAPDLPASFVQRDTEFKHLKRRVLDADRQNAVAITTALQGAGGFGKTTLATALCHDEDIRMAFEDGVLWVTLGEQGRVLEGLTKLYRALTNENPGFVDIEEGATKLADALADSNYLIVIDDVWEKRHLDSFLRRGKHCARLITTRLRDLAVKVNAASVDVDEMTSEESVELLTAGLGVDYDEEFSELAKRLGEWPLMLELTNGAIRKRMTRQSLSDTLKWINTALDHKGFTAFDARRATDKDRNDAIAKSIQVSLDLLDQDEQEHYIELAIFPEDVAIPQSILESLWEMNEFDADELASLFDELSLLKYDGEVVRLHDVMRAYLHSQLKEPSRSHRRLIDAWDDKYNLPDDYVWHYFSYHIHHADRDDTLRALLLDIDWLQAKLDATDINWLINDFNYASQDQDLRLVKSALQMSSNILAKEKSQLRTYLYGRLLSVGEQPSSIIATLLSKIQGEPIHPVLLHLVPVLDQAGGSLVRILSGHGNWVNSVAMTPDGRLAISGGGGAGGWTDNALRVWDLTTGELIRTLLGHEHWVEAIAITPNGQIAVSAEAEPNAQNTIKVWDLTEGELLYTLPGHGGGQIYAIDITADGRTVVSVGVDRGITVWDLSTSKPTYLDRDLHYTGKLGVDGSDVVATTPDGRTTVSGTPVYELQVWKRENKDKVEWPRMATPIWELKGHEHWISAVAITPDGRIAITGSHRADRSIKVWNLITGELISTLVDDEADMIHSTAISADGSLAISASNNYIAVWDLNTGQLKNKLRGHGEAVAEVAMSSDGQLACSCSADRTIRVWDLTIDHAVNTIEKHDRAIGTVAVTADGRLAVTASLDTKLKVWEIASGKVLQMFSGHDLDNHAVAVNPDGKYVVSSDNDQRLNSLLKVWNVATGDLVSEWKAHEGNIYKSGIATDGEIIVSAAQKIKVWKLATGELMHTFATQGGISAVIITPDRRYIVSSFLGGKIIVWDVTTGKFVRELAAATDKMISTVAVTSDGDFILSGGYDNNVTIWDFHTGKTLGYLSGHTEPVVTVSAAPNRRYAISGSHDATLKVWDLKSKQCVTTFHADGALYTSTVVDENTFITAGESGRLHILELVGVSSEV